MSVSFQSRERVIGRFLVYDLSLEWLGPVTPAAAASAFSSLKKTGSPAVALVRKGVDQLSSEVAYVLGVAIGAAGFSLIAFDEDTFADKSVFTVVHVSSDVARERGLAIGSRINADLRNA